MSLHGVVLSLRRALLWLAAVDERTVNRHDFQTATGHIAVGVLAAVVALLATVSATYSLYSLLPPSSWQFFASLAFGLSFGIAILAFDHFVLATFVAATGLRRVF